MQIPKKIHYCWFGNNEKPEIVKKCIESWKKYMPDYEIIEWNESNYDCHKSKYVNQAYTCKKWAFVSDYVRFDVINKYGGIYMDTDVELLKPIPKEILNNKAFTAMEPLGNVSPGLIFAAIPNFKFTKKILDIYNKTEFIKDNKPICKTVNSFATELLISNGFKKIDEYQVIDDLVIYPSNYFCSFDLDVHEVSITNDSVSVHHYAGSWKKNGLKSKFQKIIKKIFGIKIYRKLLVIKRRIRG